MLPSERTASLKWCGDFSLPRFRAKLANQYLLHPDVAPGYEELYRSDLGERTISRRDHAASLNDLTLRSHASSPTSFGGTQLAASGLTALARSGSALSMSYADLRLDASASSLPSLSKSASVPTIGLRRMEALPAAARLGRTAAEKGKAPEKMPTSPLSPEDRKEREKELNSEAMSRKMWSAAHGSETGIRECIAARVDDPSVNIKNANCPGIQKALKGGAKLDWRNDEWDGATLLLKCVRTDSPGLVEYLAAIGADPLVVDKSGRSVFHWAAIVGNPAMMEVLLTIPEPQLQTPDNGGDTPLHLAAYHGHLPIIRLLVRHKVDTTQPNALGYDAVELAQARRMWHIAHYLSEQKHQDEDRTEEEFQVRKLVRPCNLSRANELRDIAALNPKPKPKAAAKKK